MAEHRICSLSELSTDALRVFRLEGVSVAVCKSASGEVFAFENRCTHQDVALHKGLWDPATCRLTCPAHQAVFALAEAGKAVVGPAVIPLELYAVRKTVEGDSFGLLVTVPESD